MKKNAVYIFCVFLCVVLKFCLFLFKFKIGQEKVKTIKTYQERAKEIKVDQKCKIIAGDAVLKDQSSKVSVIIPAYNVELYIEDCLNSVLNQTYRNLEIIIVDDGSTDNTYNILKKYAEKDNRIKLYRMKKNGGVSRARNEGLKHITGDYLYWIDSDDWIDLNYIETMVGMAKKTEADIVINKNVLICFDNKNDKLKCEKYGAISDNINGHDSLNGKNSFAIWPYLWNNLIKVSFLKQVKPYFPEDTECEDVFFITQLLYNTDNTYIINGPAYTYRRRLNSITLSDSWIEKINHIKIFKMLYLYSKKHNIVHKRKILPIFNLLNNIKLHNRKEEFYHQLREFIIEVQEDIKNNKDIYNFRELFLINGVIKYDAYKKYNSFYKKFYILSTIFCVILCLAILLSLFALFKTIYLLFLDLIAYLKRKKISKI